MKFLTDADFSGILAPSILTSLKGTNNANINEAETLAISELDPLTSKFNIAAELDKAGDTRNKTLVRILVHITAYYLYNTVVDIEIPDRITLNWKKELSTIEKISSGKLNSTLLTLTDDEGKTVTRFRWGSNLKRSHELHPRVTSEESDETGF